MQRPTITLLLSLTLAACGANGPTAEGGGADADSPADAGPTVDTEAALAELRSHQTEFMARPEHDAERVVVRHLLVSFDEAPGPPVVRTRDGAERLTAELFARVRAGEDFAALVAEYSDDSPEGVYTMVDASPPPAGAFRRSDMVPAFGNAGWRLAVDEVGVVAHDPADSPFGWHIVKRLE